ncbi:MAG: UDP-N-acetylmuramoyl-L-alanine--D-glutamate ligase [Rickettsiales bacterium]|nr:UDP-N-acetylmuramoyl-L-alanine--D-glutamate ligase [Rickettsiales bacterium]
MNKANKILGKKLYFIGLGISNLAAAKSLKSGNEIFVYDDKLTGIDDFKFVHYDEIDFAKLDYIVLAPSIPLEFPNVHPAVALAHKNNVKIIGDIELFFLQFQQLPKIIAVTGTNGKSTTVTLIRHILSNSLSKNVYLGGNVGIAMFDLPIDENGIYVVEISSFQLDLLIDLHFDYSVLLNITPDHLDRHNNFEGYVKSKLRIFQQRNKTNIAVICSDSPVTYNIFDSLENTKVKFSTNELKAHNNGLYYKDSLIADNLIDLKRFSNPQNLLAALIIAELQKVSLKEIKPILDEFQALEHRFEKIYHDDNITIYNDSKATNAESTENALKQLKNIYWIAGGVAKEGGIANLTKYFANIDKIYLMGEASNLFYQQIDNKVDVEKFANNFETLIKKCIDDAKISVKPVNILFSPACASFDMFANYVKRGECFKELVKRYVK